MQIKLTRKWEQKPYSKSSDAAWKDIYLLCYRCVGENIWVGYASIGLIHTLTGPRRKSVAAARQDAEKLAVQILLDIRDGAKMFVSKYIPFEG